MHLFYERVQQVVPWLLAVPSNLVLASDQGTNVLEWLKQHVLVLIMTWWITFTVVLLLLCAVGFNPVGIGAGMTFSADGITTSMGFLLGRMTHSYTKGTLAAAFQSYMYGGFTPAGGIFATLTSLGMLGVLMPLEVGLASLSATAITVIVWACGVGR